MVQTTRCGGKTAATKDRTSLSIRALRQPHARRRAVRERALQGLAGAVGSGDVRLAARSQIEKAFASCMCCSRSAKALESHAPELAGAAIPDVAAKARRGVGRLRSRCVGGGGPSLVVAIGLQRLLPPPAVGLVDLRRWLVLTLALGLAQGLLDDACHSRAPTREDRAARVGLVE